MIFGRQSGSTFKEDQLEIYKNTFWPNWFISSVIVNVHYNKSVITKIINRNTTLTNILPTFNNLFVGKKKENNMSHYS